MESEPLKPVSAEKEPESRDRKKSNRKKRGGFAAPIPVELADKAPEKEKLKSSALDEALANLALKKQEIAEEKGTERSAEKEVSTASDDYETPEPTENTAEAEEKQGTNEELEQATLEVADKDDFEELEKQEINLNDISLGEVVVHLQGDQPVGERVRPLPSPEAVATESVEAEVPEPPAEPSLEQYTSQPEQQHRSQDVPEVTVVESQPEQIGSDEPTAQLPPAATRSFEQPSNPYAPPAETIQPRPEDIYEREVAEGPDVDSPPYVVGGERPATKQEMEDAIYYATKSGQNRGVIAGLIAGGGYEHFKHKRREKRQEKRFKKQNKQLEQVASSQDFFLAEQRKQQANAEQRYMAAEKHAQDPGHSEKQPPKAELPVLVPNEQLAIPPEHRLETSAWHSIEVDNKTGRPVENPTFAYGAEYYRERAQEAGPQDSRNAAAGEVALVASAMSQDDPSKPTALPSGTIPDASTQSAPIKDSVKSKLQSITKPDSSTAPLWPWIVALVVVVLALAIALR
jgi:hypothetical protein